jgi:hypothetical protein
LSKESIALEEILDKYEQAYDRLDADAATSIWPSVDSRALSRAFARLAHQDLELGSCSFAISEIAATAQCSGHLRYAQRVGDTTAKYGRHEWTIQFARVGEVWQIVRVSARSFRRGLAPAISSVDGGVITKDNQALSRIDADTTYW